VLTQSSSNVVPLKRSETKSRPAFGKVFCSDWLHSIADQITSAEFHVLFMLSRHADDEFGTTRVSAQTIGFACGLSKQYTQEVMRSLAKKGLIGREGGGNGPRNAAEYSLLADKKKVADFHDDLRDQRAERRAAFAREEQKVTKAKVRSDSEARIREVVQSGKIGEASILEYTRDLLKSDVGTECAEEMARRLVDLLGVEDAAVVADKVHTWTPKKRVAYIEEILDRRHGRW
jgi:DNA-binding MarR family transcriptional regulator